MAEPSASRDHRALAGLERLDDLVAGPDPAGVAGRTDSALPPVVPQTTPPAPAPVPHGAGHAASADPWAQYGHVAATTPPPSTAPPRSSPAATSPAATSPAASSPRTVPPPRRATPHPGAGASIRAAGPLVSLLVPALLALTGFVLLRDNDTVARGAAGFLAYVLAAPGLLAGGVPLRGGSTVYLTAAALSAVLWIALGRVAASRAMRRDRPTWPAFWAEWWVLALSCWAGVVLALVATNLVLGRALV